MTKSPQRFQFTLKGVRHEASIEMTIHTLVHSSDTFSCHCNSIIPSLSIVIQETYPIFNNTDLRRLNKGLAQMHVFTFFDLIKLQQSS